MNDIVIGLILALVAVSCLLIGFVLGSINSARLLQIEFKDKQRRDRLNYLQSQLDIARREESKK